MTPWKPGQSGNPAGRPKGYNSIATEIKRTLSETIPGQDGLTWAQAFRQILFRAGIKGDQRAIRTIMEYSDGMPVQTIRQEPAVTWRFNLIDAPPRRDDRAIDIQPLPDDVTFEPESAGNNGGAPHAQS
jgi:hypothetical protein